MGGACQSVSFLEGGAPALDDKRARHLEGWLDESLLLAAAANWIVER